MGNTKRSSSTSQVRIIGGSLRGRKVIFTESGQENALRPTPDRVRETLFNWLSSIIVDAECLDAFGGSGALSFEAISRGAKQVTVIEKCPQTLKDIKENADRFGLSTSLVTICDDTLTYLAKTTQKFDLIFLDPPFQSDLLMKCIECIAARNLLHKNGYIYLESSYPILSENMPLGWEQYRVKKAGNVFYALARNNK